GCRLCSRCQLFDPELVLFLRGRALHPVPVEGIECANTEALPDSHCDIDIVDELACSVGDREHSAVWSGQVASEEVQSDQGNARILHRGDEAVDFVVTWYWLIGPWPPELNRIEASLV